MFPVDERGQYKVSTLWADQFIADFTKPIYMPVRLRGRQGEHHNGRAYREDYPPSRKDLRRLMYHTPPVNFLEIDADLANEWNKERGCMKVALSMADRKENPNRQHRYHVTGLPEFEPAQFQEHTYNMRNFDVARGFNKKWSISVYDTPYHRYNDDGHGQEFVYTSTNFDPHTGAQDRASKIKRSTEAVAIFPARDPNQPDYEFLRYQDEQKKRKRDAPRGDPRKRPRREHGGSAAVLRPNVDLVQDGGVPRDWLLPLSLVTTVGSSPPRSAISAWSMAFRLSRRRIQVRACQLLVVCWMSKL